MLDHVQAYWPALNSFHIAQQLSQVRPAWLGFKRLFGPSLERLDARLLIETSFLMEASPPRTGGIFLEAKIPGIFGGNLRHSCFGCFTLTLGVEASWLFQTSSNTLEKTKAEDAEWEKVWRTRQNRLIPLVSQPLWSCLLFQVIMKIHHCRSFGLQKQGHMFYYSGCPEPWPCKCCGWVVSYC